MEVYFLQTIWNESRTPVNMFHLWEKASKLSAMLLLSARQTEDRFWHFQLHNKGVMWAQLGHLEAELQQQPVMTVSLNHAPLQANIQRRLCPTLRSGLSFVSMMNSYLHSSQQRVSELLIHCCRQDWWTKRRLPVQWHGVIRGLSSSPSQWQILREWKNSVNTKLEARQL